MLLAVVVLLILSVSVLTDTRDVILRLMWSVFSGLKVFVFFLAGLRSM